MVLVYYGNQFAKKDKIVDVLKKMNVSYIEIGEEDLDYTLGELLEKEKSSINFESDREIFLYFCDMDVNTITKIDEALKAKGIHVLHKAVRTDTNIGWKLVDLLDHIEAEASYFKKREKLRNLVSHPDQVLLSTNEKYQSLMVMCFELLEETDVPEKMYDTAIQLIENFPKVEQ
ncbi:hypothetical protein C815_00291 [Firmicutes bacterium M10-2]|nr:hypothetical protein C815_00291 [Firmicutes bacterium M10-2]